MQCYLSSIDSIVVTSVKLNDKMSCAMAMAMYFQINWLTFNASRIKIQLRPKVESVHLIVGQFSASST